MLNKNSNQNTRVIKPTNLQYSNQNKTDSDFSAFKEFFEISQKAIEFNKNLVWDSGIKNVYLATTISELVEVYKLRSKIYNNMGYSVEYPDAIDGLSFDSLDTHSAILYTKKDNKITGTCRLIFDIENKLPIDNMFKVDFLRDNQKKLVELSKLVIDNQNKTLSQEPRLLVKGTYEIMQLNGKNMLVSLMIKEHYRYYKKFGGFKLNGEIKNLGKIDKAFSFVTWDILEVSHYFKKLFLNN